MHYDSRYLGRLHWHDGDDDYDDDGWRAKPRARAAERLDGMSHPEIVAVARRVGLTFSDMELEDVDEDWLICALMNDYSEAQLMPALGMSGENT